MRVALTTVEDKLQLDQLHVYKLSVDELVCKAHPDVLHLHEITLQRIV